MGSRARAQLRLLAGGVSSRPAHVEYQTHPNGPKHTASTIRTMTQLAKKAMHTYAIRHLATEITRHVPSKSPTEELFAIYAWVRDNIRYRYDPLELEWVQSPERTIAEGAGDCDDMTTLIAALAGALGHPWRIRTVGATKEAQAHVAAQCWNRKVWLDLDPVLEPPQPTTAPRTDLGMFGLRARGADIIWNQEGKAMLGAVTHGRRGSRGGLGRIHHMRVRNCSVSGLGAPVSVELVEDLFGPGPLLSGLGGPVSAEFADLWYWSPYYSPQPPTLEYGFQPAQTGVYPTPDVRYRSPNAPGFQGGQPIVLTLPVGSIPDGYLDGEGWFETPVLAGNLGWGFLKKVGRAIKKGAKKVGGGVVHAVQKTGQFAHKVTHGKNSPIRRIEEGIKSAARATVVLKPFVDLHDKVASKWTEAGLEKVGMIKRGTGKKAPSLKEAAKAVGQAAKDYGSSQGGGSSSGGLTMPKNLKAIKLPAQTHLVKGAKKGLKKQAKHAVQTVVHRAEKKGGKLVSSAKHAINKALRKKYPKNARQTYDKHTGRFRIFVPVSGVHGLGAMHPMFSVSFGALGAVMPASSRPDVVAKAQAALRAVNTFAKNHAGKPPAVRLPAVLAFQAAEKGLSMDSLYGTNTRTAMAYYLPAGTKLIEPAPALRGKLTWVPPEAAAPAPQPHKPAPKPVAPRPVAHKKPAVAKPVAPKPGPVIASTPAPAGYREVGSETQNPGFPPVGVDRNVGTAKPADHKTKPTAHATPATPRPAKRPKTTKHAGPPPGPGTTQHDMDAGIDDGTTIVVDKPRLVDVHTDPLPNVTTDPQPSFPRTSSGDAVTVEDDNTWLWLAAGYLYWKKYHARAA